MGIQEGGHLGFLVRDLEDRVILDAGLYIILVSWVWSVGSYIVYISKFAPGHEQLVNKLSSEEITFKIWINIVL